MNYYSREDQISTMKDNILKGPRKPINLMSFNLGPVLLDAFDKAPDHISQIDAKTNKTTTYAEMKDRSIRCALWLEKQGISCDDVISLCTPNQLDCYIPIFASYFVQAIINPWRYDLNVDYVRRYLKLFSPKLIFACVNAVTVLEEAISLEKSNVKIVVFDKHPKYQLLNDILLSQSISQVEKYHPRVVKNPKDVAIMIATSGTTGIPKGVMISAEAMLINTANYNIDCRGKNVLWYQQPGGIVCNTLMLVSILQNATRIISNDANPKETCRVIQQFKINHVYTNPRFLNSLANFVKMNECNMDCLEMIRTSGTKLNKATFEKLQGSYLRDKIKQAYGSTETGYANILPKLDQKQISHNSIGYVNSNLQLKIIDRLTKESLEPNAVGEILIKTPAVMLGYNENPKATSEAIDAEGWYHTQDVGYYDENGEIFIIDRISGVFTYCGQEIFTSEIEDIFWAHPSTTDVAVVAVPCKSDGEVPVAFVTIRSGQDVKEEELVKLFTTFEKCETLRGWVEFIDKIPLTPSLKPNKRYLKELAMKLSNEHYYF